VLSGFTNTEFSVSTSPGGSAVLLSTTTSQSVPVYAAGWDNAVRGQTVTNSLDVTTSYQIEPRLTFTSPGFAATARTITSGLYKGSAYGDINNTYTGVSATGGAGAGALFTVVRQGNYYTTVTCTTPGLGYNKDDVLTIPGTSLGGTSLANDIILSVTKVTAGGIISFDKSGFGAGGFFVAGESSTTTTYYSSNGTSWSAGGTLPVGFTGVGAIGYGDGTWIAVEDATSNNRTAISTDGGQTWTAGGNLTVSEFWVDIHYGNGRWIAINSTNGTAYSTDNGTSWVAMTGLPSANWKEVTYGKGVWVAIASNAVVSSTNGTTWTTRTLPGTATNWNSVTYGNNIFVAVAEDTAGTNVYAYSLNGTTWTAGTLPSSVYWNAVSYGQGVFLATSGSSSDVAATSEDGVNWTSRTMPAAIGYHSLAFGNPNRSGIWVAFKSSSAGTEAASIVTGCTTRARAVVADEKITSIRIVEPGSGYSSAPALTIIDPNNITEASTTVRKGSGVLANPTFTNRGSSYVTAAATVTGSGYADLYQTGTFIAFKKLTNIPKAGSNVRVTGINDVVYKLVSVSGLTQQGDYYSAILQLSPGFGAAESPEHNETAEIRIRYSQVRLTGHDFLDIGTGNFTNTNYPGLPLIDPDPDKETNEFGGGRVFYTSTDQDGNFRVGDIFSVEQSTGVATLNADAFSIAGLQELQLGSVALGGSGAAISEFSTDPFFTADSDNIVPTQRAIKAYISSQIGSGSSALNVNSLTAGIVFISGDTITTTSGAQININTKMNFNSGVDGYFLAHTLFN
jgi:hypothetical protein